jgi:signal transduction histidine kinase
MVVLLNGVFIQHLAAQSERFQHPDSIAVSLLATASEHLRLSQIIMAQDSYQRILSFNQCSEQFRAFALAGLADIAELHGEYSQAQRLYHQALSLFQRRSHLQGMILSLCGIATVDDKRGVYDKAIKSALEALRYAEQTQDVTLQLTVLNTLAEIYGHIKQYAKAQDALNQGKKLQDNRSLSHQSTRWFYNTGVLHYKQGNYVSALRAFESSLNAAYTTKNQRFIGRTLYMLAHSHSAKDFTSFQMTNRQSKSSADIEMAELHAFVKSVYGTVQKDSALKMFQQALEFVEQAEDVRMIGFVSYILAVRFCVWKEYNKAEFYTKKMQQVHTIVADTSFASDMYEMLYRLAEEKKNYKQALLYHKKFKTFNDASFTERSNKAIAESQAQYDLEKREQQIRLLEKDNALQTTIQNALVGGSFALVVVIGLIWSSLVSQRRAKAALEEKSRLKEVQSAQIQMFNEQLYQQTVRLEEISAEKTEILNIVAHDLKNPLGGVRSLAELIQYAHISPAAHAETAAQIVRTTERMLALVKNLLQVNALEEEKQHLEREVIDVVPIVEQVIEELAAEAERKIMRVECALLPPEAMIQADALAVHQVVTNLLSNALKYSPKGSTVSVQVFNPPTKTEGSTSAHTESTLHNAPSHHARTVRIAIADQGPGLTSEDQTKLFGKFQRLSAKPTGGEHSTGLGLAIVKTLVEKMDGRVWYEDGSVNVNVNGNVNGNGGTLRTSQIAGASGGAVFVVELPAADDVEAFV